VSIYSRVIVVASLVSGCFAFAQDARTVAEPRIPAVCTTLPARLVSREGGISEADEVRLDTARIQGAMDHCRKKQAVELAADGARNAFLTGPLELRPGVTLLVARGVTLFGSRDPKDYEVKNGSCGLVNDAPRGCRPLIHAKSASGSGIMGDGTIDGRGGAKILGQSKSWWDLAEDARAGGRQQVPRLIETDATDDFTLYRITLKNSANFHVVFHHGDGFTIWGLKIDTPRNARNTDGVDPSASKNITMAYSSIRDGDDNIAIKEVVTGR
jgi:polygalacturonase